MGSYDTLEALQAAHPAGSQGDTYLVGGILHVWSTTEGRWVSTGASLTGPAGPVEFQFSSVNAARLESGDTGGRFHVVAVGLGANTIESTSDPITLTQPAVSIKTFTGGTITDISVALSIALASVDATGATVRAQLYSANPFNAREFYPVPNTLMNLTIPQAAPIGSFYTASLTGLAIRVAPGTQLVLGFHSTSTNVKWGINAHLSGVVKIKE